MKFIDLSFQNRLIRDQLDQRLNNIFEHGRYIRGPEVRELENRLANYVGTKHCVTVSSGTSALLAAMMALEIKSGDEVITTPFSFIATAEMMMLMDVKPVFTDICPKTFNLNPELIEAVITPRTKAIMPVNLYGQCADYDALKNIANKYGLYIIEDAAQSFGATYKGLKSCSLGDISCTSFFPSKPLGCYGDGGACFTNNDTLAERIRQICNHGEDRRYHHVSLGFNGRLDTIQAAVLLAKMEVFQQELMQRARVAESYNKRLQHFVTIPYIEPHNFSVYAQYTIQVENRAEFCEQLAQQGVPTAIHYPVPLHKQPVFINKLQVADTLAVSEQAAQTVVSLPFYPYLETEQIEYIAKVIKNAMQLSTSAVS